MITLITCIIYFIVGAMQDILGTIDVKAVQNNKAFRSSVVSWLNTVLSWIAFYYIMSDPNIDEDIIVILAYATGGAVGAYYIIKHKWY